MKKRTAASTIMISLAAVAGCNNGGSDYVAYNQTSPSEFEENQKLHAVSMSDAVKVDTADWSSDAGASAGRGKP